MNYKTQLKKCEYTLLFVVISFLAAIVLLIFGFTRHSNKPRLMRSVTTSDTDLAATTKNWTTAADASYFIPVQDDWDYIKCYFVFYRSTGDANTGACVVHFYGADYWGGVQDILDVNVQAGKVKLTHNPLTGVPYNADGTYDGTRSWADTITNTGAKSWTMESFIVSGTDIVGSVAIDIIELYAVGVKITGLENATDVSVIFVGIP